MGILEQIGINSAKTNHRNNTLHASISFINDKGRILLVNDVGLAVRFVLCRPEFDPLGGGGGGFDGRRGHSFSARCKKFVCPHAKA